MKLMKVYIRSMHVQPPFLIKKFLKLASYIAVLDLKCQSCSYILHGVRPIKSFNLLTHLLSYQHACIFITDT